MTDMSKFERRLEVMRDRSPSFVRNAAIEVHDTFELAWFAAQDVFGEAAQPEHAIAIYDRINAERLRLRDVEAKEDADRRANNE